MFFHDPMCANIELQRSWPFFGRNDKSEMCNGFAVQIVLMVWSTCTRQGGLEVSQNTLRAYILCDNSTVMYELIENQEH